MTEQEIYQLDKDLGNAQQALSSIIFIKRSTLSRTEKGTKITEIVRANRILAQFYRNSKSNKALD